MDLNPTAGNPCGIPLASGRDSDSFTKELTESRFFQQNSYPGNPENATPLQRNLLC